MKNIQVSNDIIPIAKFKTNASSIMEDVKLNHKSIVITKKGEAAGVLISPEDYDRLVEKDTFRQAIVHGLHDAETGKIQSDTESKAFRRDSPRSAPPPGSEKS